MITAVPRYPEQFDDADELDLDRLPGMPMLDALAPHLEDAKTGERVHSTRELTQILTVGGAVYDSGDFHSLLELALDKADYRGNMKSRWECHVTQFTDYFHLPYW